MNCKFLTAHRLRFRVLSIALPPAKEGSSPPRVLRPSRRCCLLRFLCHFRPTLRNTPFPEIRRHNLYTGFVLPVDGGTFRQLCPAETIYCSGSPTPVFFNNAEKRTKQHHCSVLSLDYSDFLLISGLIPLSDTLCMHRKIRRLGL